MTRYSKDASGRYVIHGHKYEMLEGSRAQVMHGNAYKTSGGLKKHELLQNKSGRIVSRKKHTTAKKEKRLIKAGYGTKKGKFGAVKLNKSKRGGSKGGYSSGMNSNPASVDGNDSGVGSYAFGTGAVSPQYAGSRSRRRHRRRGRRGGAASPTTSASSLSSMVKNLGTTMANAPAPAAK